MRGLVREWDGLPRDRVKAFSFDADLAHYATWTSEERLRQQSARRWTDANWPVVRHGAARLGLARWAAFSDRILASSPLWIAVTTCKSGIGGRASASLKRPSELHQTRALSPDGRQVVRLDRKTAQIITYESATGKGSAALRGPRGAAASCVPPRRQQLAIAVPRRQGVGPLRWWPPGEWFDSCPAIPPGSFDVGLGTSRGHLLATASGDHAYLWDAATGRQCAPLPGHQGAWCVGPFLRQATFW